MKKIRDMSIQKKNSCLFLGCFLVLLLCIIVVLHYVYRKQIHQELIQKVHYEDEMIVNQMEQLSQNVESCCNNLIINLNLTIDTKAGIIDKPEMYDQRIKEKLVAVMENNFLLFPDISQISVLYNNGNLYTKDAGRTYSFSEDNFELLEEFEKTNVDTRGAWYYQKCEEPAVYFVKVFRSIQINSKVGYILLKLNEEAIFRNYRNQREETPVELYVFDKNDSLLSSSQRESVNRIYKEIDLDKRTEASQKLYWQQVQERKWNPDYHVMEYETDTGWTVVSVLDVKKGMQGLRMITGNIIIVSLILMVFFFIITWRMQKRILYPVVELANHMRKTGENQIQKIPEKDSKDEVGLLVSSFNQMVETNSRLIQRVAQNEEEKRYLELALLQNQIKPHFLYNTLDTAFCLNQMGLHKDASYVIKQLAGYYRLVLNHGAEWISLSQELDALEKYLDIQSVRYNEWLSYSVQVDEELYGFQIPKMTLQPLVKNAIYHGIKPSGRKGHIWITGELCKDGILLSVTDDGVGMTRQVFDEILTGERESTDGESFGVRSVTERLRLFYGEGTKVELADTDMGTSIILKVSLKEKESCGFQIKRR